MNIRSIITVILVLVIIALGASAIFIFNKNKTAKNLADTNAIQSSANIENQGKVMASLKNTEANIAGGTSIIITVDNMEIHRQGKEWVIVTDKPTNVDAGIYDQVRLVISKVLVTKNGIQSEAKLPSKEIKINGVLMIEANKTSTVVFDIIAKDSLHTTTGGTFIFAPVVKLETKSESDATATIINTGMNVDGQMIADFLINQDIVLSEIGNVIKIGNADEKDNTLKTDADGVIAIATNNKYLDSVSSIAFVVENSKKIWVVSGLKNNVITSVYIDAMSGSMVNY